MVSGYDVGFAGWAILCFRTATGLKAKKLYVYRFLLVVDMESSVILRQTWECKAEKEQF